MSSLEYWLHEEPRIIDSGKQRFKYYKNAEIFEISALRYEDSKLLEVRRQRISAHKLRNSPELVDMLLDFLNDSGLIDVKT